MHDYFTPPENYITCDLCGDEFAENSLSTDLLHHLEARHPEEYKGVDK